MKTNAVRGKEDIYIYVYCSYGTNPEYDADDESSGPARELRVVHVELSK